MLPDSPMAHECLTGLCATQKHGVTYLCGKDFEDQYHPGHISQISSVVMWHFLEQYSLFDPVNESMGDISNYIYRYFYVTLLFSELVAFSPFGILSRGTTQNRNVSQSVFTTRTIFSQIDVHARIDAHPLSSSSYWHTEMG